MAKTAKISIDALTKLGDISGKEKIRYPNVRIKPENKENAEYHKKWSEKIYSLFINGSTWIPSSMYSKIDEYRSYSDGRQNMDIVKDWILGKAPSDNSIENFTSDGYDTRSNETVESRRKAWENIDFSPVSVAPKIKTKINEHIRSMYYELRVNAIDSYSVRTEEHEKYRLWFFKQNLKWMQSQAAAVGAEIQMPDFLPENLEELELYAATGGFKVPYAIAMEDLLKHTFIVSDWDKEIAERIRDDLFTLGHSCIREEFDPEKKRVVAVYCDPKYTGIQFSGTRGHKNAEWGYTMEFVNISEIRSKLNLTGEQAASIAFGYSGKYGNPSVNTWGNYDSIHVDDDGEISLGCDFYKVPVFVCEWTDIDNDSYIEFQDNFNRTLTKPYKGTLQENEQLKSHQYRYIRTAKWIPGTSHIFDYGRKQYIPRDRFNKPRTSFRGIKLMSPPILEQIMPFLKGFSLSWIKAQHAIAIAVSNGLAVDVGAIRNISIGKGANWDPLEVLQFYRQSSFFLYKKPSSLTGLSKYNSAPIIPINNSMSDNIRAQFEAMNVYMQKIEDVSGISMISTGKTPDPDVAKFNMQVTLQGTNEIINSISRAQTDLQEDISVNICYRIRSYCRQNKEIFDSYAQVIGERRMKAVVEAERNHVDYGINIEASDISEEKRVIMGMLQAAMAPEGANSQGMLSPSESVIVIDMIHQGQNLRRVGLVLGYMLRRKAKEAELKQRELIELQNKGNLEMKQMEMEAKKEERNFEIRKIQMEFWKEFTVKHGIPPAYNFGQLGNAIENKELLQKA